MRSYEDLKAKCLVCRHEKVEGVGGTAVPRKKCLAWGGGGGGGGTIMPRGDIHP